MTHIAIQEALDGKAVDWLEHVSDEQYGAGADASSRQQSAISVRLANAKSTLESFSSSHSE